MVTLKRKGLPTFDFENIWMNVHPTNAIMKVYQRTRALFIYLSKKKKKNELHVYIQKYRNVH